jgi:hypothetical protein
MYLDDDPPIAAGREIRGFPKKHAHPKLGVFEDMLTGTLVYARRPRERLRRRASRNARMWNPACAAL